MQKDRSRQRPQSRHVLENYRKVAEQPDSLWRQWRIYEVVKDSKDPNKSEFRKQFIHLGPVKEQARIRVPEDIPDALSEAANDVPGIALVQQDTAARAQQQKNMSKEQSGVTLV